MKKMNNKLTLFLLLFEASASVHAQLVCQQNEVDCGQTLYQHPITATYELQNNGGSTLVISDVDLDGGCSQATLSKKSIAPGQKCEFSFIYDAQLLGHFVKQALITYHGGPDSTLLLAMKGEVCAELKDYSSFYPYAMGNLLTDKDGLEFDDVSKGEHPFQEINILNNSQHPMIPNIQHLPSYLSVASYPEKLEPGQSGKLTVTLLSEELPDYGLNQSIVYLASHLGDKISSDNEMPVSVVLLPNLKKFEGRNIKYAPQLKLSTTSLDLGKMKGKNRKKATIQLTNTGRLNLKITKVQMFTKGLQLTLDKTTLRPGESGKLKIVADVDVLKKTRTKPRILMITNDPKQSKIEIPVIVQ